MGLHVNPTNASFWSDVHSPIYVDKTGLLEKLNAMLFTSRRYVALSRARRFGKSMAAGMIDAYYSRGCDSRELFAPYEIAKTPGFEEHLNQYNVLHIDVAEYLNDGVVSETVKRMDAKLLEEFQEEFPEYISASSNSTAAAMAEVYRKTEIRFIVIIDEWDCIIRDAKDDRKLIQEYLRYLRGFFKSETSKQFLALGYITGILPIKKYEGESAMNVFEEYTMVDSGELTPYFGFTQEEVERLAGEWEMDLQGLENWYDGYLMKPSKRRSENGEPIHMYNPNSLVKALQHGDLESYWKNTGAFRGLNTFIERNEEGLRDDIKAMLAGEQRPVDISTFQNDLTSFRSKDDVLAALIHMGYLGYDAQKKAAFIPNREVREVFESAIKVGDWVELREALRHSDELLRATSAGDGKKVAEAIEKSHQDYASIIAYHDENALACAMMMSFYTARNDYEIRRELPAGRGFADLVFLPKQGREVPAMVVELKWNRSARAAIKQIRDRQYAGALSGYPGDVLLVGINYTKKTGRHTCRIERVQME